MAKEVKQPDEFEAVNQKPFWKPENEGDQVEGWCTHPRNITGEFGEQTVMDVGEYSVGISAGLQNLLAYEGRYVRLTYQGFDKSKKGRDFKKFLIEVKKTS